MSRTIRRKNAWNFEAYDYVYTEELHWTTIYYPPNSPEYKLEKNKYHRDKRTYRSGVPHAYTNLYAERPLRRKTNSEIYKWMQNPDNVEIMVPEFQHDIGWYYW